MSGGGNLLAPAADAGNADVEQVEDTADSLGDHVVDARGHGVKRRHGREDDGSRLGRCGHVAQVHQAERGLAGHQNQPAALLQGDIRCAGNERVA